MCDSPFGWLLTLKRFVWQDFWQNKKRRSATCLKISTTKNLKTSLISLSLKATAACSFFFVTVGHVSSQILTKFYFYMLKNFCLAGFLRECTKV
jgi:hypothetical protein